jgi:glycosyltransferase involved in cell wall biosynthesis
VGEQEMTMKVCFFSPTAYSYFRPSRENWAGGAEIQQLLVARHMLKRGIDVSFIVGDYGQPDVELVNDITVIKSFAPFRGNRKLRFLPDMFKIYRAMRIADADVYNQRSTSFFTGQLAYFTSLLGRVFTFSIGIDYNCYADCDGYLPFPMTNLYRYGIRRADAVIAQTELQQGLLKRNLGRDAVLIRNCMEIPPLENTNLRDYWGGSELLDNAGPREFLWVGSFRRRKRPELFLELARRVPEAKFTIIGGRGDDESFHKEMAERARSIANVYHEGFVKPSEISHYYGRAYALVNTSFLEGFPNTYLHAWVHGIPTYTIEIDPDGIIERHDIGRVTGSIDGLVSEVRALIADPDARREMSKRARRYVEENHDVKDRGNDYIRLFRELLEISSRKPSRRSG